MEKDWFLEQLDTQHLWALGFEYLSHFPHPIQGNYSFFLFKSIYLSAWGLSWGMWDRQSSLYFNRIYSCSVQILSCGMWDLVSWLGIEPQPPALGAWNLCHWTTREVPQGRCSFTTIFPPYPDLNGPLNRKDLFLFLSVVWPRVPEWCWLICFISQLVVTTTPRSQFNGLPLWLTLTLYDICFFFHFILC